MTKHLVIVAALMTLGSVAAIAQDQTTGGGSTLNTNNKFQVSLQFGKQSTFDQNLSGYLTTKYKSGTTFGLGGATQSKDPETYLNFSEIGSGDITNIAGINFAYFINDAIDVNLSFGMDIHSTPKQDYLEPITGTDKGEGTVVQGNSWVEGKLKHTWILSVGGNYHFATSNEKIDLIVGGRVGYQHGMIETTTPYTYYDYNYLTSAVKDREANNVNRYEAVLAPRTGSGDIHSIVAEAVAGISYSLLPGLSLGLEFSPYSFQYSLLEVIPQGSKVFQAEHFANRLFTNPQLKLSFRF